MQMSHAEFGVRRSSPAQILRQLWHGRGVVELGGRFERLEIGKDEQFHALCGDCCLEIGKEEQFHALCLDIGKDEQFHASHCSATSWRVLD